jgi:hypothetical protein
VGIEDCVSHWSSSVSGYANSQSRSLKSFDRLTRRFSRSESICANLLFVRLDVQFDLDVIANDLGSFDDFVPG